MVINRLFFSLVSFPNGIFASAPDFSETEIKIWNPNNGNLGMTLEPSFSVQALAIGNGNLVIKEMGWFHPTNKPINGSLLRTITNIDYSYPACSGMVVLVNGDIACVVGSESLKPNESWYMKQGAYLASLTNGDLAIGLNDYIEIWNPSRQILLRTLRATSSISALACLPNGDLASGVYPNLIVIWNPFNGTLLRTLNGKRTPIRKLTVLSNGYIAGAEQEEVKIWNPYDGKLIQTLKTQSYRIMALATLPNEQIAIGLGEKTIQIWDSMKGVLLRTLTGQTTYIYAMTILPNGDLATGVGGKIAIWNPNSGELMKTLGKYLKDVKYLILLKNGDLASGHSDGTIKIWKM
ncbi:hypothetical protein BpHYR1_036134 [Brachionus plicatilis]|uniref:Uncharacterized protein n=1 Tax=Brachionus plicatilis TaxID=10195 RepID=A0A3M7S5J5_BRAPC|nr:hypothetical protein BpHYR1_036134 [Brachionus plicatilis]